MRRLWIIAWVLVMGVGWASAQGSDDGDTGRVICVAYQITGITTNDPAISQDDADAEVQDFAALVASRLTRYEYQQVRTDSDAAICPTDWTIVFDISPFKGRLNFREYPMIGTAPMKGQLAAVSPLLLDYNAAIYGHLDAVGVRRAAGFLMYQHGDCDAALREWAVITTANGGDLLDFYRGNCALLDGDFDRAIGLYENAVYRHGGAAGEWVFQFTDLYGAEGTPVLSVVYNLAWTYVRVGQSDAAFALMDDLRDYDGATTSFYVARAHLHALNFDYDAAIADINAAINLYPDNPALYVQRGQFTLLIYEWDAVLADYNTAIDLDPTYADAYYWRGLLYYTVVVDRDRALPDFQTYLDLAPDGLYAADAARYATDIQREIDALND